MKNDKKSAEQKIVEALLHDVLGRYETFEKDGKKYMMMQEAQFKLFLKEYDKHTVEICMEMLEKKYKQK